MNNSDSFDLQRFVDAQEDDYEDVCQGTARGSRKRSHWIWYIFPQIRGLGNSGMSRKYAISSREEAAAYLEHPVLGPRLRECTPIGKSRGGPSRPMRFSASPDDLKFRSCMTLFAHATSDNQLFMDALRENIADRGKFPIP